MSIQNDSIKVLKYALKPALDHGDIHYNEKISPDTLSKELGMPSEGYCRVCCQYLHGKGLLQYIRHENPDETYVLLAITSAGIDALEEKVD